MPIKTTSHCRVCHCCGGAGGYVGAARREANLTQKQGAAYFNKPQSFVSKSENGERRVDPVELRHLAKLYGKPLDYFV